MSRLIKLYDAELTLTGVTLRGGVGRGGNPAKERGYGGAIYNDYGVLRIRSCTFTEDTAQGQVAGGGKKEYASGGEGGAIYNDGKVIVTGSTFSADTAQGGSGAGEEAYNEASYGGAIYTYGDFEVSTSTFTGNTAAGGASGASSESSYGGYGGAIYAQATLSVANSTFSANTASGGGTGKGGTKGGFAGYGGAIYNDGAAAVAGSAFSANTAGSGKDASAKNYGSGGEGGAIYNDESLTLSASTVSANAAAATHSDGEGGGVYTYGATASGEGGGFYNDGVGDLANVTLFGNTAQTASGGGNLYLDYYTLTLHDTLIAGGSSPTSGGNCAFNGKEAFIVSEGYNAESQNQCTLSGPEDKVNASLALGPLQNNDGPTATIALLPGSAAIDTGDPAGCTDTEGNPLLVDQRGVTRPQGAHCDLGAYEYVPPPPPPPPVAPIAAPAPVAPRDSSLTLIPSSFAPESSGASVAKAHHKKPPLGVAVSYTDSEAASTTFNVVLLARGYGVGHSCKTPPKHGKRPKHAVGCTLDVAVGSFTHSDVAGKNSFKFTGRVGGHALAKGSYKLQATPKLGALSGVAVSASFTIV